MRSDSSSRQNGAVDALGGASQLVRNLRRAPPANEQEGGGRLRMNRHDHRRIALCVVQLSNDKIEQAPAQRCVGGCHGLRLDDAVAEGGEELAHRRAEAGVIVDYQNAHAYGGMGCPLRNC